MCLRTTALVASAAIYGTHYVLLRALKSVGGEPLPTVFVTFVRYQFLMLFAALLRGFRAFQSSIASVPIASTPAAKASATSKASAASKAAQLPASGLKFWLHATELALYTLVSALLGIYGSQLVPAITSEILGSTMHLFVPVLTLVLLRRADFGARTWAGCALAFSAALVTAYAGAVGNGGGAAGGRRGRGDIRRARTSCPRIRGAGGLRAHRVGAGGGSRQGSDGSSSADGRRDRRADREGRGSRAPLPATR